MVWMAMKSALGLAFMLTPSIYVPGLDDKIKNTEESLYVFEVVRHGARSTDVHTNDTVFPVSDLQLTPQGMRQRYLLGKYAAQKYK